MFDPFMAFMAPYWTSIAMFIFVYSILGLFEDLIGIRGLLKWVIAIVMAVLFFHFWDDFMIKLNGFFQMMGLQPVKPGTYK